MTKPDDLIQLIDRLSRFFFVAKRYGDALHAGEGLTTGERALLMDIATGRGVAVPQLADQRGISRQATQKTVDLLVARTLVSKIENQADRRSRTLRITGAGREMLKRIGKREEAEVEANALDLSASDVEAVGRVIDTLEAALAERTSALRK